ncbi:unnamed protein product [Paramecium sonneborni]|uniref:Uncharacterized protein n=1 Tax=Paramecium sonneborni TaxID=65129 RepID=A0A8S1NX18_9CILI|nr:unnamed protein product [Paramecium sonneborni]
MQYKQYKECRLCQSSLSQFQIDYLKKKYYNSFHFYFGKSISEILGNLAIDHVILYKDLLYFNDDNEYLTKYYNRFEQKQIICKLQFKVLQRIINQLCLRFQYPICQSLQHIRLF